MDGHLQKISDLINDKNEFLVKLRCENFFDSEEYETIKRVLVDNVKIWKKDGNVPIDDVVAIMELINQLAGGSRFFDEETAIKIEDACIEIEAIITELIWIVEEVYMKNPVEQINNIANMDDFLTFVVQLAISKINIYFTWKRVVKQSIALFFVIGNLIDIQKVICYI